MKFRFVCALVLYCLGALSACAEDLGTKSQTYKPDPDAREQFKDVVRQKQSSGELDKFWKEFSRKNIDAIKNPTPLGIKSDYANRTELRSLAFRFPKDIRDEAGRVVVKAGTVVQPLKVQPLVTGLVFIDGRDQRQVDYAIARGRKEPLKIVLTAGSPYDLRVKYQNAAWYAGTKTIPFYFDQRKMIIDTMKRLYGVDINSVPLVMTQRDDKLSLQFGMEQR